MERKFLLRADKNNGVAALRAGIDADGNPVLIKVWPRDPPVDDVDIRDIWRNEIRELYRLAGYPGVSDYIVELKNSGEDEFGFYLVLSPGQRRPLESLIKAAGSSTRRLAPKSGSDRALLWTNLRRIASGLEILHLQGLLHRNLTTWSILTADGEEPDFQLTGFEWSMRLVGADTHPVARKVPVSILLGHSFTRDWQHFGQIASSLFNISSTRLTNLSIPSHDVSEVHSPDETKLIRELLQIIPTPRVDGRFVLERIDSILTKLTILAQRKEPQFSLVLALGPNGPLASAIRGASGLEIEVDDLQGQREFVENDLFDPLAMSVKIAGQSERFRLILRGQRLTYHLEDFVVGAERTPSNWEIAYCSRADGAVPLANHIINQIPISLQALKFMTPVEARKSNRLRGRFASWEDLRRQLKPATEVASAERRLCKSLALGQILDYLFAAAEVFPVEVIGETSTGTNDDSGRIRLFLRARSDRDRDDLSRALGLQGTPGKRLRDALTIDRSEEESDWSATWVLTNSGTLGDKFETATEWQFESIETAPDGKPAYCFSGDQSAAHLDEAFLVSDDSVGQDSQLKRRMRSFKALSEHVELARMLSDPRARVLSSEEKVESDVYFSKLDDSKQKAFKAAAETLPLFMVQGPPGVGKTRLVRELVRARFSEDKATRLLLSAQSNPSVDHLLHEIEDIFDDGDGEAPLIIRCKAKDKKEKTDRFDIGQQSKHLLGSLMNSSLFHAASSPVRERIRRLAETYQLEVKQDEFVAVPQAVSSARKALESLVLRSANLVFATTNSADLERLIDEKGQFDWTIVEEAGKASGGELVSPLLFSHRRLMIGDHKQLPPFNAERFLKLLEAPKSVQKALQVADPMIGRAFRDAMVDEIFTEADGDDLPDADQIFSDLCAEASRNFLLFETLIESEFERQKRGKGGRPIATALTIQHRMHPAIAELVGRSFYDVLVTDPDREQHYRTQSSVVVSADINRLPDSPIVWINMPWVQNTIGMKFGDRRPAHTNNEEVRAVTKVLELLRAADGNNGKPSLAVLSPYSRQVARLSSAIDTRAPGFGMHLSQFVFASKQSKFCNTVDSFQGNEADCVIVSLVRNNGHGSVLRALGFLADARRMNVLLSRARWRMVLVGSLDFLESISQSPKSAEDAERAKFLNKMLNALRSPSESSDIKIVPWQTLAGSP